jgi:hypothetical protein
MFRRQSKGSSTLCLSGFHANTIIEPRLESPIPGADVAGATGEPKSWYRCGRGEPRGAPIPATNAAGVHEEPPRAEVEINTMRMIGACTRHAGGMHAKFSATDGGGAAATHIVSRGRRCVLCTRYTVQVCENLHDAEMGRIE